MCYHTLENKQGEEITLVYLRCLLFLTFAIQPRIYCRSNQLKEVEDRRRRSKVFQSVVRLGVCSYIMETHSDLLVDT